MPSRPKWYPYLIVPLLFAAIFVIPRFFPVIHWVNPYLYGVSDALGGGVAILLGAVLYLIRPFRTDGDLLVVPALSFIVTGEAELVGLFTENPTVSTWLDCQGAMTGALVLLCLWLPRSQVRRWFADGKAAAVVAGAGLLVPLVILLAGESRLWPAVFGFDFAQSVKAVMILSGLGFLGAAPAVSRATTDPERRLIVLMALFLGLGGVSFFMLRLWTLKWWLIQFVQLVPFLFALAYLIRVFLRNQRDLFESEMRFRTLFNESPLGIGVVANSRYSFAQANPALVKLLGYSEAELIKLNLKQITHPDDLYPSFDERNRLLRGETTQYQTERRYFTKDRRELWLKVHGALFKTSRRGGYEFRLVEDITQEKLDQEKIKQMAEELSDANLKLKHFASVASHDLKAPLATISNFVQLIARRVNHPEDAELNQYFTFVVDACKRLRTLIDDLLVHARIDDRPVEFAPVDCSEVLDEVLANLTSTLESNRARVNVPALPVVRGDRTQLTQLFQNLVDNALKYRGEKTPEVSVMAEDREKDLLFTVKDNGIGFPPEYSERIFNAFERLHSDRASGSGLGLPICKSIVKRHGGKIWADAKPGEGATFYFTLPKSTPAKPIEGHA